MQLYGLKTCDTCRKALKTLKDVEFIDVRGDGVPEIVLKRAFAQFEGDLLNTRSTTWRALTDSDRQKAPLDLLQEHPTLMKRPLIVDGETMYLGWGPHVRAALGAD